MSSIKKYSPVSASVIVAIYNTDLWIKRCLDSLQNQSINNFEVLLIDDGSLDESSIISDEYSLEDLKFCVFHKLNGGVSSARQCGLVEASGEYIIHADPDDWTESVFLEHLLDKAQETNADMVICDIWSESPVGSRYISQKPTLLNHKIVFYDIFHNLHGSCCNKLIRKKCFFEYGIFFCEDLVYCEDKIIIARLLQEKIKICHLSEGLYHYVYGYKASLSNLSQKDLYFKQKKIVDALNKYIKDDFKDSCMATEEGKLAVLALLCNGEELNEFSSIFTYLKKDMKDFPLVVKIYFKLSFWGISKVVGKWMRMYTRLKNILAAHAI